MILLDTTFGHRVSKSAFTSHRLQLGSRASNSLSRFNLDSEFTKHIIPYLKASIWKLGFQMEALPSVVKPSCKLYKLGKIPPPPVAGGGGYFPYFFT